MAKKKAASSTETIISTLQKRVDAGTAGANDKKRLAELLAGQKAEGAATTEADAKAESDRKLEQDKLDQARYQEIVDAQIKAGTTYGETLADKYFDPSKVETIRETVSPEVQATIDAAKKLYEDSQKRTAEDQLVLDKRISGLDGYTSAENAALREAMRESMNRDRATSQRELMRASGGQLTAGALAGQRAGIDANYSRASANQGRDLLIANVDEKQKRLEGLSTYVAGLDEREFAKKKSSLDGWTSGEQNKQGFETMATQYNQGQRASNTAGRVAAELGGLGAYTGLLGGVKAEDKAQSNLDRAMKFYEESQRTAREASDAYQKSLKNY